MRRLLLLLVCGLMLLGMTNSAFARRYHVGRHFGHSHHVGRYVNRWSHRSYYGHHYAHRYRHYGSRYYSARFYTPRYYSARYYSAGYYAPNYLSYGYYSYPWQSIVRQYVPVYRPYGVRYYYPGCVSYPSYSAWSFAQSSSGGVTPPLRSEAVQPSLLAQSSGPVARPKVASRPWVAPRPKVIEYDFGRQTGSQGVLASLPRNASTSVASPRWSELTANQQQVDLGDRLFRGQFYAEALKKYESAASRSPNAANIQFRRGHTLTALGRYADATAAFQRGLALNPAYIGSDWRLEQLYGGNNRSVMDKHVETLAGSALQISNDPDLFFLIGVFLHFDSQPDRAGKFFRQAAELGDAGAAHLRPFLNTEPPAKQDNQDNPRDKLAGGSTPAIVQTIALRR